ncbi:MAG: GNAT family N-acetyltransferase [Candidatus Micrarchaeota archaeon]
MKTIKLCKKYQADALKLITKTFGKQPEDDVDDIIEEAVPKSPYREKEHYVIFEKKNLVGIYGLYSGKEHPKNVIFIGWFIVDKKYRNRGIGSKIMKKVEKRSKELKKEFLYVISDNPAISFYRKFGFKKSRAEGLKGFYFPKKCTLLYKRLKK